MPTFALDRHAGQDTGIGDTGTAWAVTLPGATAAGCLIVVAINYDNSVALASITDNASGGSNVYHKIGVTNGPSADNGDFEIWYAWNTSPASIVTANFGSANPAAVISVNSFTGVLSTSDPLDVQDVTALFGSTTGTDTNTTSTVTPNQADSLIFGAMSEDNGAATTITHGTGFTDADKQPGTSGRTASMTTEWLEQSVATAIAATFTASAGGQIAQAGVIAFKPGGGGGPTNPPVAPSLGQPKFIEMRKH